MEPQETHQSTYYGILAADRRCEGCQVCKQLKKGGAVSLRSFIPFRSFQEDPRAV